MNTARFSPSVRKLAAALRDDTEATSDAPWVRYCQLF
jgi:hypothetical protein